MNTSSARTAGGKRLGARVLFVVLAMFLLSAVLRIAGNIAPAMAREMGASESSRYPELSATEPDPAELREILETLTKRSEDLDARESAIEKRLAVLTLAEADFEENRRALVAAEEALRATISLADHAAENDIATLTLVYENMRSEEAVPLFEKMSAGFAAGFLGRMRADAAAAILAGLDPDLAYSISVIIAGRNARAGLPAD